MAGKHRTPVKPGTKWGKLTVLKAVSKNQYSQVRWEVRCDCGRKTIVWGYNLVKKEGNVTHCGCSRGG